MDIINIHQAKTHLSRLVEKAAKGESFVIAKAGKPVAKVVALDAPSGKQVRRVGFLKGEFSVPDDFNEMGKKEIAALFGGNTGKKS
jgi:prevent-host-death family protein